MLTNANMDQLSHPELILDRPLSRKIAARIPLYENRCFQNCYWGIRHLPGRAWLVIGLAEAWGDTLRHVWLEWAGRIVDPSWVDTVDEDICYFPIHRYSKNQLRKVSIMKLGRTHREPMFSEWYKIKGTGD